MSPYRYHCTTASYLKSWFSIRGFFWIAVIGAICYYGWPVIEAVLLLLPVPDPRDMKAKGAEYMKSFTEGVMGSDKAPPAAYQQ